MVGVVQDFADEISVDTECQQIRLAINLPSLVVEYELEYTVLTI